VRSTGGVALNNKETVWTGTMTTTTPTAAHSVFGGSVATRVLHCPASVRLADKVPEHLRKPSAYAERGTALHAAMALLLDDRAEHSLASVVGKTFNDYTITSDDVETAVRPAYDYAASLIDMPGAAYFLEHRVKFPFIDGAFGTADLIVRVDSTIYLVDFKFGSGVRVYALYPDGDEDIFNAQLLFYAAGARHTLPNFFADVKDIILSIAQPVSIELDAEPTSSVTVTNAELDEFVAVYRAACEEALSSTSHLERGAWCRFCPAKPICPAHTGPLLDFAQFTAPTPTLPDRAAYLQALAAGLDLIDAVKDLRVALHDQAKAALENGDVVPGYALTAGRAERRWRDDERTAIAALESLGLARDDIISETMRSPKQVEIRAKARGLKVPSEFIVSSRPGTSLVRSENAHTPILGRSELARSLAEALKTFQKGSNYERP
jgi:hypothetical protein